jgi:2-keto-3-deoxy-L-rhamnonate aldolase RhmA
VKEKLEADELVLCMGLRHARVVDFAMMVKACGFDAFYVDLEHGMASIDAAAQLCVAGLSAGIAPLVRVPTGQYETASRLLDGGALGILFPHVETPEEARRIVDACKVPPIGTRGVFGSGAQTGYQKMALKDVNTAINRGTVAIAMLETLLAIDNAEAIAAIDGIDILQIGTNDLCSALGIPGEVDHPKLYACYERAAAAAKKHGKTLGIGNVAGNPQRTKRLIDLGARFVTGGNDVAYLMAAARKDAATLREMLPPRS